MKLIEDLFKGLITLSLFLVIQNSCSVKQMAFRANEAHKKGLSNYKAYSKLLTGFEEDLKNSNE